MKTSPWTRVGKLWQMLCLQLHGVCSLAHSSSLFQCFFTTTTSPGTAAELCQPHTTGAEKALSCLFPPRPGWWQGEDRGYPQAPTVGHPAFLGSCQLPLGKEYVPHTLGLHAHMALGFMHTRLQAMKRRPLKGLL